MYRTLAVSFLCAVMLFAQEYRIVGPKEAKPHEATAIKDLTDYLARRVKGGLTIGGRNNVTFHVGDTELAKKHGLTSDKLPDEKWIVKSFGGDVVVNGGGRHGALYATYHFLEDLCDIHWWSDYEDYVPTASPLELPVLDMSGKPYFQYRNIHRGSDTADELTAFRNRLNANGAHVRSTAAVGGSVDYGSPTWTHTHHVYIDENEYFKEHPDYFAMNGGKRSTEQLCLSNPDLPAVFAEKLCKYIEHDRAYSAKMGVPYPIYYDISMNDGKSACTCDKCSEYARKYNYSAQLIEFLNDIARRVGPKYPDIFISSLAYYYNDTPPNKDIKTERNVVIRLCDTTTNQAFSILHPDNAKFKSYVSEWKKYTDNLHIWDYAVIYPDDNSALPFASEFHYGDLYKFYRDNNVKGIFWEHEYEFATDMYEYKFFLECKLMEDPDADLAKLQNIFMTRYYGDAAPFVMEYRRIIDKACHDNKGTVAFGPISYASFDFLTPAILRELDSVMDRAESSVNGDELLISRIRRARLGIDLLSLKRSTRLNSYGIDLNDKCALDYDKVFKRLAKDWRKWTGRFHDSRQLLERIDIILSIAERRNGDKPFTPPKEFKDKRFIFFTPEQFDRFRPYVELVDDAESCTGKTVRINGSANSYYKLPFEMGCYDNLAQKSILVFSTSSVSEKTGYNWYKMGRLTVKKRCDLYFSREWTIQIPVSYEETVGRSFDVWASLKFTGPLYHPNEKEGDSFMYLDLVILEDVKED